MGGGDKTLLEVGGHSMLARILDTLRADVAALAINANGDPARFASFGLPVVADDSTLFGKGPLVGVLAAMDWAAGQGMSSVLTVPGDTPLIPRGLAQALAPAPACASSNGQSHFLVTLWPVGARAGLREFLSADRRHDVRSFGDSIGLRSVDLSIPEGDRFMNANTREDLDNMPLFMQKMSDR